MTVISAIFHFLSQHSLLSMPLFLLSGLAIGAVIARWRGNAGWLALGALGFVLGMVNVFTGSMTNALFLNAYGTYGSAVVTHAQETSSQLNDQNIWAYDVVMKTADGRDVKTGFDTMSASLYPVRNAINIPPVGERFVVKYIPGFERNIAIMQDESAFGKRLLVNEARGPVDRAAEQLAASPDNASFKQEYREVLKEFMRRHGNDAPAQLITRYQKQLDDIDAQDSARALNAVAAGQAAR